jgi:phospholipid/cholesterol/gamma-HCH transport system substrate-binding protein
MKTAIRRYLRDFVAILGLAVIALGIAGYILENERLRFPFFEEKPFQIWIELSDAQGVMPGQGQTIRVAGMRVGDVGKVELKDGRARVRADLDAEYDDLIHRDASALLRPRTGLKDMFIEVDPGSKSEPLMKEGEVLPAENSAPDVDADETLRMLDYDTRPYFTSLITGAGKGLRNRGSDLREVFARLGPLHRDLRRLNTEVVKRRRNLARLVHTSAANFRELATRDEEIAEMVQSSEAMFRSLASEDDNISLAISRAPSTLAQVEDTLHVVDELGRTLPALEDLRPVVRQIHETNQSVRPFAREATPILRNRIRPFVRVARPYVRTLRSAAGPLSRAQPDLRESFFELNRFFNIAAYNPGGAERLTGDPARDGQRDEGFLFWLGWVVHNTNSLFSTSDAMGPYRRVVVVAGCSTWGALFPNDPDGTISKLLLGLNQTLNDQGLCSAN